MNKHVSMQRFGAASLFLALLGGCSKAPEPGAPALPAASPVANVADIDITTNVKTALLQDADLKGFDITVVTLNGDVRLTGVVDTQGQIDAAGKIARGAEGAHTVHDHLTLKK